jgi:hypothetical protein
MIIDYPCGCIIDFEGDGRVISFYCDKHSEA